MFYYTYLIQSLKDNKWYTGITEDLRKRFKDHNSRKVFSTKGRGPFQLIYYESCLDKNDAFAREKFLKSGPGKRYLKNRLKRFRLLTGFTLVESLVVVTIILVLLVTVLVNYRVGERNLSLDESAAILGQNFRKAEEMAMSAKEFQGVIPQGGYGINLKTGDDFYVIFADCNNDHQYTLGNLCNGFPEKVEQVTLAKRSKIASLLSGSYLSVINIVFIPPNPLIMISGTGTEAIIKLSLKEDVNVIRTVRVNKAGLIEAF